MAGILSQSQLNAIFGQYRQTRVRALAASPGVAVAEGWQDSSQPSLDQVYRASTLDTASERERLTPGAGRGRRGISPLQQAFCRQFAKRARRSSIFILTC